jgi:putative ABC transport system permease protein
MSRDQDRIVANASLVQYNEITPENADSFHFHGDLSDYPLSAVLVVPNDTKSGVILQGRLENAEADTQIVRPREIIEALLETVFTIQQFVVAAVALVGAATVAVAVLVILLSLRLRRRERLTLFKIGGSQSVIAGVMAAEIMAVIIASSLLALTLTVIVDRYGAGLIRTLLLS